MKALWNNQIIAESNETIVVEGNHYFPGSSANMAYLTSSDTKTQCLWKGEENKDAAWYCTSPKEAAKEIKDYVAFWKGIEIME